MESQTGLEHINSMYEKVSYFDQYGGSVILFIIVTIALLLLLSFCFLKINAQFIVDDWPNQRCKPHVIPFAGFITHPEGVSATEYTYQNFTYCTQNILANITGDMVQPLSFIIENSAAVTDEIKDSLNAIRVMFKKVRTFFQVMAEEVMGRSMNVMITLQKIIISFKDVIGKIQGTLTAGLFTLLGTYYTLKSLLGAIAQFVIIILITLAIMIATFWILPFTIPAAISGTAVFIAISIPMILILTFMTNVLKIHPSLEIPSIKCFDKNTMIRVADGTEKCVSSLKVGELLWNNNKITAVVKVETKGSVMYLLNGIAVSDSHIVQHNKKWIPVSQHPEAILLEQYDEPFLYCLNTTNKTICVKEFVFTDWDELFDGFVAEVKNNSFCKIHTTKDIHTYLDGGFHKTTPIVMYDNTVKTIDLVKIGDILEKGARVVGVVEIDGRGQMNQYKYKFGRNSTIIGAPNLNICEPSWLFTSTLSLVEEKSNCAQDLLKPTFSAEKIAEEKQSDKLYHLLTDKQTFCVENICFYDYNASIDLFLDKCKGKLLSLKYVQ